jgi:hypothetical protein
LPVRGNTTWTPQRLAWSGLLMAWGEQSTLVERFHAVCECLKEACSHWQFGSSYDGWVSAQEREQPRLVPLVVERLRRHMREFTEHQCVGRWEVYAVDGSDGACPRTIANQTAMSDVDSPSMPQLLMTVVYHMRLGLPWAFRVGPGTDSERGHLREMVDELPAGSLLVADAGFIGYEFCSLLLQRRQHFLLRVGGNMHLLNSLGYAYETEGETVYLWPLDQQQHREPPLRLRLIVVQDADKEPVYLVTSALDHEALSDEEAGEIYRGRWGIEGFYRTSKQTLERDRVQSRTPEHCYLEKAWSLLGAWLLDLMAIRQLVAAGRDPHKVSAAGARNAIRRTIRNASPRPRKRHRLLQVLAECFTDDYVRHRPKASRNYPRKKRHKPPTPPKIKPPTAQQIQWAQALIPLVIGTQ